MQESDRTKGSGPTFGAPNDSPTLQPDADLQLAPGTLLAGRYQIIDTLGVGGMGAVYKAFDRQLTRVVALKTILPELAATPTALKRFKQEVLLAQQIVHKNVVRIFDMGEDGATKFITMDFVEGRDLKSVILERGKFEPKEAVAVMRQVCSALEAAHGAHVVHRDLKPQNIMIQNDGNIMVMDFGIAQSRQNRGATLTVGIVGTPEYMSPEQARSEDVDARSDIFSVGIIFYEMLTGKVPLKADTILETMFKRTKEPAPPPAEVDRSVPKAANDIVVKCLEIDREKRYANVGDILADLEDFDPSQKVSARQLKAASKKAPSYRNWVIAIVTVALVAAVGGYLLRNRLTPSAPVQHPPMTVLVADLTNQTGETLFDNTLEPVVKIALEGASFITAYDRTRMRDLGLQAVSGRLEEDAARKIALGQGLGVVVSGSLARQGDGYLLSIKAVEAVTGNTIRVVEDKAASKDQVVIAATKLAGTVRKALGDDSSDSTQRFAMDTLSATSLEAVHEYALAMNALANGKYQDAMGNFSKAVEIDQNFGLAYAGMAIASRNLGKQQDAETYIKLALNHLDKMTERERYRTRGSYYLTLGDADKCVEEYGALINKFPSDAAAHNNLALCWTQLRNMTKAQEQVREAAKILPKRLIYRWNTSIYASYGSDFQIAEAEAGAVRDLDPSSSLSLTALALAQLGEGHTDAAAETYKKLEKTGAVGASDARAGLADVALYEGRFADAGRILEQGAADDLAAKSPDRAAAKFAALAFTRLLQGQKAQAIAAAQQALDNSKTVKIRFLAGRIFAAAGNAAQAKELSAGLAAELQRAPHVYAKLIDGEIFLASGDSRQAINAFTDANNSLDTWIGRFELGKAYLAAEAYTEADSEFDRCIKRRGEALSLFLDESPTYGYFPQVYYYIGRVREGLKNAGFAESYRTYVSLRSKSGEDPLLPEIKKRIGQ